MKRMSAKRFAAKIISNPAWASTLTEDLKVSGSIHLKDSEISSLSPHLHFSGDVEFHDCPNLEIAEGSFKHVAFGDGGLKITKNLTAHTAYFIGCSKLKVAEGDFTSDAHFIGTEIEKIGNLGSGSMFVFEENRHLMATREQLLNAKNYFDDEQKEMMLRHLQVAKLLRSQPLLEI